MMILHSPIFSTYKKGEILLNKNDTRLSLTDVIDEVSKYDELVRVEVEGVGFTEVYRYFKSVKIDSMLEDYAQFTKEYMEKRGTISNENTLRYLNLFILVHFSTLVDQLPETFESKFYVFEQLLNSEIAETVAEAFDKQEVAKIIDRMMKKFDAAQEMISASTTMRKELIEQVSDLENKDTLMKLFFDKSGDESGE